MEKYDLIIVGAGPAGIFTAVELFRRGAHKKILMVEKGQSVEKRSCPKSKPIPGPVKNFVYRYEYTRTNVRGRCNFRKNLDTADP